MRKFWPIKDPNDNLDYPIDWELPDGDSVATATWTVPEGLVVGGQLIDGNQTIIWLSGGIAGTNYDITCKITTLAGRTKERTIILVVAEQ